MDVSFVIRQRLEEFGLDQRELARAAQVTESYISQLLTRKKAPPAPSRTDIYDKMDRFLKLPSGELARLAAVQRRAELKRELKARFASASLPSHKDLSSITNVVRPSTCSSNSAKVCMRSEVAFSFSKYVANSAT